MSNQLIGKTITAVYIDKNKHALRFDLGPVDSLIARADADCCSHTWIESLDAPEVLVGSPVLEVSDLDLPDRPDQNKDEGSCGEVTAHYGCQITTAKGRCVIDYRNESNGYYGGNLSWPGENEYYYGGVFDQQAVSTEWEKLA